MESRDTERTDCSMACLIAFQIGFLAGSAAIAVGYLTGPAIPGRAATCDLHSFDGSPDASIILARCGEPWTKNVSSDGTEEWVYDASTFVWFRGCSASAFLRDCRMSSFKAARQR